MLNRLHHERFLSEGQIDYYIEHWYFKELLTKVDLHVEMVLWQIHVL